MSASRTSVLGAMAAAPAVLSTLAVLGFAACEMSGATPLSLGPPRNVAEAAGAGQVSEVLRFLRDGEDPSRFWPVRPEIISSTVTRPTGLEAALWGGRQLIELLDRRGLIQNADTRHVYRKCALVSLSRWCLTDKDETETHYTTPRWRISPVEEMYVCASPGHKAS